PLLALPGNPVSSYVSFELFVRPAIRTLMGLTDVHRPRTRATLTADGPLTSPKRRRQFLRGRYADGAATPRRGTRSHLAVGLARARRVCVPASVTAGPGAAPRPARTRLATRLRRGRARGTLSSPPSSVVSRTSSRRAPPAWSTAPARTSPGAPPAPPAAS